jgi:hypothetical protein
VGARGMEKKVARRRVRCQQEMVCIGPARRTRLGRAGFLYWQSYGLGVAAVAMEVWKYEAMKHVVCVIIIIIIISETHTRQETQTTRLDGGGERVIIVVKPAPSFGRAE